MRNFNLNQSAVELYQKIYDIVKSYTSKYDINDNKLIRYTIKPLGEKDSGEWNVCYKLRRYSVTNLNYKKLAEGPQEDNEEYILSENEDTENFRILLEDTVKQYQKELCVDTLNEVNFPYYLITHINLYPEIKKFRLIKNILSRMPYHIDSSKYTIIQHNVKGIMIENKLVKNSIQEAVIFPGHIRHKVEIGRDERLSVSTFIFEKGTDLNNDRLKHEVERDKKYIIK